MPHFHLSLQAGDDLILKRMKRRHSRAEAVRIGRADQGARGPTRRSAPTSSPASRPRPRTMALNSLQTARRLRRRRRATSSPSRRARTRRRRACRRSTARVVKARAARLREAAAARRSALARRPGRHHPARADREQTARATATISRRSRVAGADARRERRCARSPAATATSWSGRLGMSWLDRLRGGFTKTAGAARRQSHRPDQHGRARHRDARRHRGSADRVGPRPRGVAPHPRGDRRASASSRLDERGLRTILAEEIEEILAPVAKPLEICGFPRPHVMLVIGVNGSGKTTTIAKLAPLAQGAGLRRAARRRRHLPRRGDRATADLGRAHRRAGDRRQGRRRAAGIVFDGVKQATATGMDVLVVDTAGRLQNKRI